MMTRTRFAVRGPLSAGLPLLLSWIFMTSTNQIRAAAPAGPADRQAAKFIAYHEEHVRPLDIAVGRAWWTANTTGRDEDFAAKVEAQKRLDRRWPIRSASPS